MLYTIYGDLCEILKESYHYLAIYNLLLFSIVFVTKDARFL